MRKHVKNPNLGPLPPHRVTDKPIAKIGRGGIPILENGLTVYQDRVIQAALETGFKSIAKLCKFAKVPERNFFTWMKSSPVFQKAWENAWGKAVTMHLPAVIEAVAKRAIKTGDPQAARVILELKNLANKQVHVVTKMTDEELHARIAQLAAEAGIGIASGGSGPTEKGKGEQAVEGNTPVAGHLDQH